MNGFLCTGLIYTKDRLFEDCQIEYHQLKKSCYIHKLSKKVENCKLCPRLTQYIWGTGRQQTKKFMNQVYWAKPVPTFGDPKAKLLVIGLAPAAHGGNRTEEYLPETVLVTGL